MERTYVVETTVTIDDPAADDPEMEFAAVATAVMLAAQALTHRSEGFEPENVEITVREVL